MGKGKDVGDCCVACGAAAFCCLVFLIAIGLLGLGIAKIVMGALYLHDCSIEKMIPIYLIVSGVAPIFFGGLGRRGSDDDGDSNIGGTICGTIGLLFNIAWLICGSIWVYPNYGKVTADDFTPCTANVTTDCTNGDCKKSLITFAFAMVTIDWILICLWIAFLGCILVRVCCKSS